MAGITGLGTGIVIIAYVVAGILVGVLVGLLVEQFDDRLGYTGPEWTFGVAFLIAVASGALGWQGGGLVLGALYATYGLGFGFPVGLFFGWFAD